MYQILDWQHWVSLLGALGAAIFLILLCFSRPQRLMDWVRRLGTVSTIAVLIAFMFGGTPLWRLVWGVEWLNRVVYPDLNGVWQGEVYSNWPLQKMMLDAAREGRPFDVEKSAQDTVPPLQVTLRIRANWFRIRLDLETDNDYDSSKTLFVVPERDADGWKHKLWYVFETRTRRPVINDVPSSFGAAWLDIRWGDSPTLEGLYWTNRNWTRGLNTAGEVKFRRINRDPNAVISKTP